MEHPHVKLRCKKTKNLSWDVLGKHNPVLARWSPQAVQPNQFGDPKEVGMYKTPPPVYWCESISWHLVEQLPIRFTMILKIGFQSPNLAKKRAAAHLLFTSPHAESHEPWSRTVRWRKLGEELRKHWTFRATWAFPVFGHSHIQPVIFICNVLSLWTENHAFSAVKSCSIIIWVCLKIVYP